MTDDTTPALMTDAEALEQIRALHEKWEAGDAQPTATVRQIGAILERVPASPSMADEYKRGWESVSASTPSE